MFTISPDKLPVSGHVELPQMSRPRDPPTGLPKATNPFGCPIPVTETSSEQYERCLGLNHQYAWRRDFCFFFCICMWYLWKIIMTTPIVVPPPYPFRAKDNINRSNEQKKAVVV